MHPGNDTVGREHEIAAGRRRKHGGIVGKAQCTGMRRQWPKAAGDQSLLG